MDRHQCLSGILNPHTAINGVHVWPPRHGSHHNGRVAEPFTTSTQQQRIRSWYGRSRDDAEVVVLRCCLISVLGADLRYEATVSQPESEGFSFHSAGQALNVSRPLT